MIFLCSEILRNISNSTPNTTLSFGLVNIILRVSSFIIKEKIFCQEVVWSVGMKDHNPQLLGTTCQIQPLSLLIEEHFEKIWNQKYYLTILHTNAKCTSFSFFWIIIWVSKKLKQRRLLLRYAKTSLFHLLLENILK